MLIFQIKRMISREKWCNYIVTFFFFLKMPKIRVGRTTVNGEKKRMALPPSIYAEVFCAAWPDNICLESTSLPPKGFQKVLLISITIFISSYLHFFKKNTSFSKIFVTLDQDYLRPSITWQKERACNALISEFPAPSVAIYIYSKQFSVV